MTTLNDHRSQHRIQTMTDPVLAAASAVTQQASMIQAMRDEGERRVAAFRERVEERAATDPSPI